MRIQHNIMAKNSYRHKTKNSAALGKNLEKLSSGYKINRAGDDAAGLAISEKMRAQITGLDAAQKNVKDGISLIKTAEGAMQEIHDMLQRLGYLAAEAANGTYDDPIDRQALQDEVDALLDEIERIKDTTDFNGIPLLLGEETITLPPVATYKGGLPTWVGQPQLGSKKMTGTYQKTYNYTDNSTGAAGTYTVNHPAARLDFSGLNASTKSDLLAPDTGFYSTCCSCQAHYSIKFVTNEATSMEQSGQHYVYKINIDNVNSGADLVQAIIAGTSNGHPNSHFTKLMADPADPSGATLLVYDNRANLGNLDGGQRPPSGVTWTDWFDLGRGSYANDPQYSSYGIYGQGVAYKYEPTQSTGQDIMLQIGDSADEADRLYVDLPEMTLTAIGINGISVDTTANALDAMGRIKDGINYVSSERGRMGAYQNRLEHTQDNLAVMEENIQDAESNIRDTDVAEEMMTFTKNNILSQSAQAMLAQANTVPQGVLQLLQ